MSLVEFMALVLAMFLSLAQDREVFVPRRISS